MGAQLGWMVTKKLLSDSLSHSGSRAATFWDSHTADPVTDQSWLELLQDYVELKSHTLAPLA